MDTTEKQLIERAMRKNDDAFCELMGRYQNMVFGYALALLKDYHKAEDAAQEVFFVVFRKISTLQNPSAFPAWLRKIVYTTSVKYLKGKAKEKEMVSDMLDEMREDGDLPVDSMMANEEQLKAHYHMFQLPQEYRVPLLMHYCAEVPLQELSRIFDIPEGTLKTRMHKGRQMLKDRLLATSQEEFRKYLPEDFSLAEKVCVFEKLALLLDSGTPLVHTLQVLQKDCRTESNRMMLGSLLEAIMAGNSISGWVESGDGRGLPSVVQELLYEGETFGFLEVVASCIADYLRTGCYEYPPSFSPEGDLLLRMFARLIQERAPEEKGADTRKIICREEEVQALDIPSGKRIPMVQFRLVRKCGTEEEVKLFTVAIVHAYNDCVRRLKGNVQMDTKQTGEIQTGTLRIRGGKSSLYELPITFYWDGEGQNWFCIKLPDAPGA